MRDFASLLEGSGGPDLAEAKLQEVLHAELRRLARKALRLERRDHTLQPTALVNEAYLRLVGSGPVTWESRAHFFNAAAQAMRRILVDYARKRHADKRDGERFRVEMRDAMIIELPSHENWIALNSALDQLQELSSRCAKVVELRFFAGLSVEETAEVMALSPKTIKRESQFARVWLEKQLRPLSGTVGGANYTAASGQLLSNVGAVIALEKGPVADEFFLTFEKIGTHSHDVTEPSIAAATITPPAAAPDYGMRTFDELNASMSTLTGVPITNTGVAATFASVKQAMPSVENIDAFLASHQTGVAQLAIAYCSAMVDGGKFFAGTINPNQAGSFYASQPNRDAAIAALGDVVGDLTTQPSQSELYDVVNPLLTRIATSQSSNPKGAGIAAKAACAAVLGSAAITVQ